MLLENTFSYDKDLDPNYLIGDNYGYLNNENVIQISVINMKL